MNYLNDSKYKILFIRESKERLEDISHLLLDLEKGKVDSTFFDDLLRGFHSIKGMASSMRLEDMTMLSHRLEEILQFYSNSGKRNGLSLSKETVDLLIEGEECLESMIRSIEEEKYFCQQDYSLLTEKIEGFLTKEDQKKRNDDLETIDNKKADVIPSEGLRLSTAIKIDASILDGYINLLGELISPRSRLMELSRGAVHYRFKEDLHTMDLLLSELYKQILAARLLPFDNIGIGLTKLLRDLSRKKGKEVELSIEGGSVKLDRAILEKTLEPLIHILRNAVDHGIEEAEERNAFGKPQKGRIELKVNREKEGIVIEVSDDGRGIDPLKIKDKAVSMGLISHHKADRLKEEELLLLTSLPGFTMTDKVTEISGRGVGMDVVKGFVDEVGGCLKIRSELCRGTNITMVLPLTISIIRTLLISIYPDTFALPVLRVKKVVEPDRDKIKKGDKLYYFSMGKRDIPILSLRKILKMPPLTEKRETLSLVLVNVKGRDWGLIVDDLIGEKEVYVKPLKNPLDRIKGISGYTLADGGRPVFLLDLNNLF